MCSSDLSATGDKVYPAELIESILIAAKIEADKIITARNAETMENDLG